MLNFLDPLHSGRRLSGGITGPGCVRTALPELLSILDGSKALIVTGNSIREKPFKTDIVPNVESILREGDALAATFSEIGQHTPVQGIADGVKAFKASIVVSIGGGSPIDATKIILYRLHQEDGSEPEDSVSDPRMAPAGIILDAELNLVAVQMTALHSEALYWVGLPPPPKILCYAAIADLFKYLPASRAKPSDLEARQKRLIAA
ncbi:hypothetical protein F5I97DRAFT_1827976 [Phlebopus sp. FC_14]|nr:hypothetical protein F5I97DRAFT_1827976 [Phlebopus sp. FC_14]